METRGQETVGKAEQRLMYLLKERERLTERISSLRRLAKDLASLEKNRLWDLGDCGSSDDVPVNHEGCRESMQSSHIRRRNVALRRACRIALMETETPETARRIVQRIARRSSFSFDGILNPQGAVAMELDRMVIEGEASVTAADKFRRRAWSRVDSC